MSKGGKSGIPHNTGTATAITKSSATGIVQPVTNPLDLWYLCEKINYALASPVTDKDGSRQYQRVVTRMIREENMFFDFHHPYIGECGYDMTRTPPQPIMSIRNPNWPSSLPLSKYGVIRKNYLKGMHDIRVSDISEFDIIRVEVLRYLLSLNELEGVVTPEMRRENSSLKEVYKLDDIFKIKKGLFRVPDIVKLSDITLTGITAFQQGNIDDIIEIKFNETNDRLTKAQQIAYEYIAGDPKKLHLLKSHVCQTDDRRRRRWLREAKREPLYVPLARGLKEHLRLEAEEYQHLIGAIDLELSKVNAHLHPVLDVQNKIKYDTPYKLEAQISYEEKQRIEQQQAEIRRRIGIALGGPMWLISAIGVGTGAVMMMGGTAGVAVTGSASGAFRVGAKVIEFSPVNKEAARAAVAAGASATAFELAAKDTVKSQYDTVIEQRMLNELTDQRQQYIYWDD